MYLDGLEDAYEPRQADGRLRRGDRRRLPVHPRGDMDAYAIESLARARRAVESGAFAREIVAGRDRRAQGRATRSPTTSSR